MSCLLVCAFWLLSRVVTIIDIRSLLQVIVLRYVPPWLRLWRYKCSSEQLLVLLFPDISFCQMPELTQSLQPRSWSMAIDVISIAQLQPLHYLLCNYTTLYISSFCVYPFRPWSSGVFCLVQILKLADRVLRFWWRLSLETQEICHHIPDQLTLASCLQMVPQGWKLSPLSK